MRYFLSLVALASLTALPLAAQERAAGQANDAQVNWSALSAKLNAIDSQNRALSASLATLQTSVNGINGKLDAIAACGGQKKVWNGSGCSATASACYPTYVAKVGTACPANTTAVITSINSGGQIVRTPGGGGRDGGSYGPAPTTGNTSCLKIVCS